MTLERRPRAYSSDPVEFDRASSPDPAYADYQRARIAHWNAFARGRRARLDWSRYYHRRLAEIYRTLVPVGQRVLELGSAQGDLLAALEPAEGVGVDFSASMIDDARLRYPHLRFIHADVHSLDLTGEFDAIILSDLLNELWDAQAVFERLAELATEDTLILVNTYSRLWQLPLGLAERLGFKSTSLTQNWFTTPDIVNLLRLANLEVIRSFREVLWPLDTPLLAPLANRHLVKIWPLTELALTNFLLARPKGRRRSVPPSVSVIVPARNEAGNIDQVFARTPQMGRGTELIFVEGHSSDDTYGAIERAIARNPGWNARLFCQKGVGKGDAVRLGFAEATGDILMILDADLTVPPEDLVRFYRVLECGQGQFVNGVRLVYPMEGEAMRFANLVANKFFGLAFTWLLGQPVKDTLCGTKVLWKDDYARIAENRSYFGDFDPFGDFDLLFGAARLSLRIVDLPIRYRARTYGSTNIQRWTHGWLLLRMMLFAARRLKFV